MCNLVYKKKKKICICNFSFSELFSFFCLFSPPSLSVSFGKRKQKKNAWGGAVKRKGKTRKKPLPAEIKKINQSCIFHMAVSLEELNPKIPRKGPASTEKRRGGFFPLKNFNWLHQVLLKEVSKEP